MFKNSLFILLFTSLICYSQNDTGAKINHSAPKIHIKNWIDNIPKDKNLKNKFIVLHFWSAECSNCQNDFVHLNRLKKEFDSPEILFLSHTNADKSNIFDFRKKTEIKTIILNDPSGATLRNYRNNSVFSNERTLELVLIDKQNKVKWMGTVEQLNSKILENFINKNLKAKNALIDKNEKFKKPAKLLVADEIDYYFNVEKTKAKKGVSLKFDKVIFMSAATIPEIYEMVFKINPDSIYVSPELSGAQYKLLYKNTNPNPASLALTEMEFLSSLGLSKNLENKKIKTFQVKINASNSLQKSSEKREGETTRISGNNLYVRNTTLEKAFQELSKHFHKEMIYKGEGKNQYDFVLNVSSFKMLKSSLKEYGIELQPSYKTKKVIAIEPKGQ